MRLTPFPSFLERARARRGDPTPALPANPNKLQASLYERFDKNKQYWIRGIDKDPDVAKAIAMLGSGELPATPDIRHLALAERILPRGFGAKDMSLVPIFALRYGIAKAVEIKLHSNAINLTRDASQTVTLAWLGERPGELDPSWEETRAIVCGADDATFAAALDMTATWRRAAPLDARVLADFLFPTEPEWANADVREFLAKPNFADLTFRVVPLLASASDESLFTQFIDKTNEYWLMTVLGDWSCDIARTLEPAAATRTLTHLFDKTKKPGKTQLANWGVALAALEGAEAAERLATLLVHSPIGPTAVEYFRRFPDLAQAVLPKTAQGSSKNADAARSILVASAPKDEGPVAEGDEVPAILRNAPWRRAKKSKPVSIERAPLVVQPRIEWAPNEKERAARGARAGGYYDVESLLRDAGPMDASDLALYEEDVRRRGGNYASVDLFSHRGKSGYLRVPAARSLQEWTTNPRSYAMAGPLFMLATFGDDAIAGLLARDAIALTHHDLFEAQLHVVSHESIRIAAAAFTRRKAWRKRAGEFLVLHAADVARTLVPYALLPSSHKEAMNALKHIVRAGRRDAVLAVATELGADVLEIVREWVDKDPLADLDVKGKVPDFVHLGELPPIRTLGGKRVPLAAVEAMLEILRGSSIDVPYAGLEQLEEQLDRKSLADFAWGLVSAWLLAGAKVTFEWIPMSLALIGDDAGARHLAPYVRDWARKDAKKAKLAVDLLAAMGTDTALLHLSFVADKARFEEVKSYAQETLERVAASRGLTMEELADRTVPDLELDPNGTTTLDFGPRHFIVTFDEGLHAILRQPNGDAVGSFPRGTKSDDAAKVKLAQARHKGLKADCEAIATSLLRRYEQAMVRGRTWNAASFRTYVVAHPLVGHIARRLLWKAGTKPFRIAEDGSFADQNDAQYTLPDTETVTLPHPLALGDDALAWAKIFADYAIVQPFEQLGRLVLTPSEAELASSSLTRFEGKKSKAGPLMGSLDARGWQKHPDETSLHDFGKKLRTRSGHEATVSLAIQPGIDLGEVATAPEQEVSYVRLSGAATFAEIAPIEISELLRDLEAVTH